MIISDALSNTWSRLKVMAARNSPRLQGFSRFLISYVLCCGMVIVQCFFHSIYIVVVEKLPRVCKTKTRDWGLLFFVSFADFCFGEQLCRFSVSMLWFSVQDNWHPGFSELSSAFFVFHELKTHNENKTRGKLPNPFQNSYSLTSPYGQFVWSQKCQKSYIPYRYNTDTFVKRTLGSAPLVSVLKRFDCSYFQVRKAVACFACFCKSRNKNFGPIHTNAFPKRRGFRSHSKRIDWFASTLPFCCVSTVHTNTICTAFSVWSTIKTVFKSTHFRWKRSVY